MNPLKKNIINKQRALPSNTSNRKQYNNWIIIGLICFIIIFAYMLDVSHEIINTNYNYIKKYYKF